MKTAIVANTHNSGTVMLDESQVREAASQLGLAVITPTRLTRRDIHKGEYFRCLYPTIEDAICLAMGQTAAGTYESCTARGFKYAHGADAVVVRHTSFTD